MGRKRKIAVWLVWLFVWPSSLYALFYFSEPVALGDVNDIIAFAVLASIVALFPLQIGDNPVFFTHGITFAVFLYYGLAVEVVVSQIALLFLLLKLRVGKANHYRYPINFLMFLMISASSAFVYYALGGVHGPEGVASADNAVPVVGYVLFQVIFNQLSIKFIAKFLYRRSIKLFDLGFFWDVSTGLLVMPVGFLLYMVYTEFDLSAVFFVGFPFILISGMLMLYHNSNLVNGYLKRTSRIGHELTGNLGAKDVLDLFVERLTQLLPLDYVYIFDVKSDQEMALIRYFDRSEKTYFPDIALHKGESISGNTWKEGKSFNYRKKSEWAHLKNKYTPNGAESALSVPIERKNEIVGVITIYSNQKFAFQQFQFMILNILGNYLAVAIDNARHYERTKEQSERCPLTGLYNFRYFQDKLYEWFGNYEAGTRSGPISLILLDLDHFKSVNDKYGHESGNEVLCEFAGRLESLVGDQGVVARYGGEEFAVLLPGYTDAEAFETAENIRLEIAGKVFRSYHHILERNGPVDVSISASIGVATYPHDCEEPLELIRHADRAMYVGAKQKGRNRVARYESLKKAAESL
ncbi:sensor domain-containing diguanylate cyclase [Halobacillus litoralis]|uniref:sensor domain-containing diguanylate cyclase n=1 Tax=Halobacillus litoralis TaxID=45668 RepID=UPI001CD5880E|nr:sensor domain-containing diguanylate cyclase [Halobacillus litoralis]MCA0969918.1 sensor domain-containing diguanylate cyclase [Halobacillus litoralis]